MKSGNGEAEITSTRIYPRDTKRLRRYALDNNLDTQADSIKDLLDKARVKA